jgi:hypothetical protein
LTSNPFFIISHSGHNDYHFNTHRFLFGNLLKAIKGDDYNNNHQRRGKKLIGRCCTLKRGRKKAHQVDEKPHTQLKWPTKGDDYQLIHLINLAANLSVGNISGVNIFLFIL